MTENERASLVALLYQLADDELVVGHRDSEWLGLAPHIEEDIAYGSIAQDEVGHATTFYRLLEELGEGKADDLAFLRPAGERRNAVLLERPNGIGTYLHDPQFEWGYTVARRFAYDLFDAVRLEAVAASAYQPLGQLAAKIRREEKYHLMHHALWFRRLAGGTTESRQRLIEGIGKVWGDIRGLFALGDVQTGAIFPATEAELWERWCAAFQQHFDAAGIPWPEVPGSPRVPSATPADWGHSLDGRSGQHTPELVALLETMGEVYRIAPGATW